MIKIRLYGELVKKYGREFIYDVNSVSEAIRALSVNLDGFEQDLMTAHMRGIEYIVKDKSNHITYDGLSVPIIEGGIIRIAPVIKGRKDGLFQTVLGVALIAVGVMNPLGIFGGFITAATLKGIGLSLVIGGAMQLLSPTPKMNNPNSPSEKSSYLFSGAVNSTSQGSAIPVGYGTMLIGSVVISAGISTANIAS